MLAQTSAVTIKRMARDDAALSAFSLRSSAVAIGVRRWRVADRSVANETFDTGGHIVPREHARIMIIVAAAVRPGGYRFTKHPKTRSCKSQNYPAEFSEHDP